ncbi:hypothetical protein DMENIID0001_058150 [Sergentomyia squamirostris]
MDPSMLVSPRVTYTEGIPDSKHSGYIQYTYTECHESASAPAARDKEVRAMIVVEVRQHYMLRSERHDAI